LFRVFEIYIEKKIGKGKKSLYYRLHSAIKRNKRWRLSFRPRRDWIYPNQKGPQENNVLIGTLSGASGYWQFVVAAFSPDPNDWILGYTTGWRRGRGARTWGVFWCCPWIPLGNYLKKSEIYPLMEDFNSYWKTLKDALGQFFKIGLCWNCLNINSFMQAAILRINFLLIQLLFSMWRINWKIN